MSDGDSASAGAREESDGAGVDGYDEMLETLDVGIKEALEKIESGRVYNPENERVRIKWIRCLAYAVNVRRQVTTDRDLDDLTERIEELEELQEGDR